MSVSLWLERLRGWDEVGFHLLNGSLRNRFFDLLMPFVSNKWNFAIPLGVLLLYVLLFRPKRDRIITIAAIVVILLAGMKITFLGEFPGVIAQGYLFSRPVPFEQLPDAAGQT